MSRNDPQWLKDALADGRATETARTNLSVLYGPMSCHNDKSSPETKPGKKDFVAAAFDPAGIWTIPVWLASEANMNDKMRAGMARKQAVKKAVWGALGSHWRIWGPAGDRVRAGQCRVVGNVLPTIRVVRLGGRGLDVGNLWRAVKAVEDALAILMGCDDGWTSWRDCFFVAQEPGPLWGCRIEIGVQPRPYVTSGRAGPR